MSSFTEDLHFESTFHADGTPKFHRGRRIVRTCRDLEYRVGAEHSPLVLVVPKGFETDLASVPRIFWPFVAPDGPEAAASVLHDWLYRRTPISRWMTDVIFFEALGVLGVSWWRRWIRYGAVRAFGWAFYGREID